MNVFSTIESRKLTGLCVTFAALLVLVLIAVVVVVIWQQTALIALFQTMGGYVTGMGTAHQGAQMMADRSPNYPNAPTPLQQVAAAQVVTTPSSQPAPPPVPTSPLHARVATGLIAFGGVAIVGSTIAAAVRAYPG